MKTLAVICALVCVSAARAEWHDLQTGLDQSAVVQRVGMPLLMSKSRSGAQVTWTYDAGGCVLFENRRVSYWQVPRGTPKLVAKTEERPFTKAPARKVASEPVALSHMCQLCGRAHLVQVHRPRG